MFLLACLYWLHLNETLHNKQLKAGSSTLELKQIIILSFTQLVRAYSSSMIIVFKLGKSWVWGDRVEAQFWL